MRPTPLEVRTASFRRVRRGYDPAEVDSLLQRVADRYEAMWRDHQNLEQRSIELQDAISRIEQDDARLTQAFASAQATADRIRTEAQADADKLRADAHREADDVRRQIVRRLQEFAQELGTDDAVDDTARPTLRELVLATIEALDRDGRGWSRQ
jgi:cell division initiation protein